MNFVTMSSQKSEKHVWFRLYARVLTSAWVWQLKVCVYLSRYMLNYQRAFYHYFRNIRQLPKGKSERIAISPSFPYLLYTIFSSSNDSPLPDIFSTMFFLRYRG